MTGAEEIQLRPISNETSLSLASPIMTDTEEIMWTLTNSASKSKSPDNSTSWHPAKRIITFMGMVSAVCTAIVVTIVVVTALFLHQSSHNYNFQSPGIIHVIPSPEKLTGKPQTIVIQRDNVNSLRRHITQMVVLLKRYHDTQNSTPCAFSGPSKKGKVCRFPLEKISSNCTFHNRFGYDVGNPCVALVFYVMPDWKPVPYTEPPSALGSDYDPTLVYLTCTTEFSSCEIQISYSPFHGFPLNFFPPGNNGVYVPPLVMVQFIGIPPNVHTNVKCELWAKNIDQKFTSGQVSFSLLLV